jgi:hypothetical protein
MEQVFIEIKKFIFGVKSKKKMVLIKIKTQSFILIKTFFFTKCERT